MKKLLLASCFILGCSDSSKKAPTTFTVWSGWNHTWDMLAHRVSLVRVKSGEDGTAESGILGGDWSTGETWSDDVHYRIHQQELTTTQLKAQHGETTLIVGPDGTASASSALDLSNPDLVVLRGFEINTDTDQTEDYTTDYDPALGYTSRGFGMGVSLDGNEVVANSSVLWGPRDRDDVNAAALQAQTLVTIYWTAISGLDELPQDIYYSGSQTLAHTPPNSLQSAMTQPLEWTGDGVAAITDFELNINDVDGGNGGDYLRSFGVEIAPSESGEAPPEISAEILNYNLVELAHMQMDFTVNSLWIPIDTEKDEISGQSLAGTHTIGSHVITAE